MAPLRHPGGSPTLDALARQARGETPRQAHLLSEAGVRERLELAAGVAGDNAAGLVIAALFVGCFAIAAGAKAAPTAQNETPVVGVLFVAAIVIVALAAWAVHSAGKRRRAKVAALLAWPDRLPFPASGWRDWLVADRPVVDVVLATDVAPKQVVDAARAVSGAITVEHLGERTFRLASPALTWSWKRHTVAYGDVALARRLVAELLVPVHAELGIAAVRFGGTVQRARSAVGHG